MATIQCKECGSTTKNLNPAKPTEYDWLKFRCSKCKNVITVSTVRIYEKHEA